MTDRQEILLCCFLTLVGVAGVIGIKKRSKDVARQSIHDTPVASQGASVDPRLSRNWGWEKIRLKRPRLPASGNSLVAVIDTGCDVQHPELAGQIWRNPGETGLDSKGLSKETNGVDDDGNGFIDDVHGWNFSGRSNDLMDEHGHGTHISGISGKVGGGSSEAVSNVKMMILKYYDVENDGLENLQNTVEAIRYAVRMGADVINYSGGGALRSQEEEAVLRWASEQGVLVVAAAGNEGVNSDFVHFYPADYELPNILSVAATDQDDELLRLSNYGTHTVQIAAPGKNIYSTLPNAQYGYMSGTSQATAFATGVAALLMTRDPRLRDPAAMIRHLIQTSSPRPALRAKLFSGGVLDASVALQGLEIRGQVEADGSL